MSDERDPVDVAAEILNWTGEPGCYSCDVKGPGCLWHGVSTLVQQRLRICEDCGGPGVSWEDGVILCDDCAILRAKRGQMNRERDNG